MILSLTILFFWILLIVTIYLFKDYLHPAIIFCLPWCVFLSVLRKTGYAFDSNSYVYLYFLLGGVIFVIGTTLGNRIVVKDKRITNRIQSYYPNYFFLKTLIVFDILFTIYTLVSYYRFIRANYVENFFISFYMNKAEFGAFGFISYGRNVVLATVLCMLIGYSHVPEDEKKKYKKYLVVQTFFYFALAMTKMTRNGILSSILPIVTAIIIVSKARNKTIIKWVIAGGLGFIALFSVVSVYKSPYLYKNNNVIDVLLRQFSLYGTGGFVAFQKKFDSNLFQHLGGKNTARTLLAIYDAVFGTNYAPPLIQEYTVIGNDSVTNVYTFYYWYTSDFGIIYALFIQFIIGIFHGKIYRQMTEYKLMGIYNYCIFLYPLIMQIFQDQYFSLLSNWIQLLVFGILLLKTNILFSRKTENKSNFVWYINE